MMGGFHKVDVTQEHREILTGNQDKVENRLNLAGSPELKIVAVYEQIVNGKYIWFHLTNNQDGNAYSACVFQPNTGGVENLEVAIAEPGHTQARNPN